jgi:hypothetical protein
MAAFHNKYKAKEWNALCDSCGFKFKASELRLRWDGLMVDNACWETRQPQDLLRAVKDPAHPLPWTRSYDDGDGAVVPFAPDGYVDDDYWINAYDTGP